MSKLDELAKKAESQDALDILAHARVLEEALNKAVQRSINNCPPGGACLSQSGSGNPCVRHWLEFYGVKGGQ